MDLERSRKDAKALVRSVRAGDAEAAARAERVLGARARERFVLADAQLVVAREAGESSWRALLARAGSTELVEAGRYREGEPTVVRVRRRAHWVDLDDDGRAVALAGRPPGWLDVAEQVVEAFSLNVNRRGVVFVRVHERRDVDELARRVGETSRALYAALLELGEERSPSRSSRSSTSRGASTSRSGRSSRAQRSTSSHVTGADTRGSGAARGE